jgi:putative alpha-1,2-mannosidase
VVGLGGTTRRLRRRRVRRAHAVAFGPAALVRGLPAAPEATPDPSPTPEATPRPLVDAVDPTIGSGGFGFAHGSAFVGATSPHGLVKLNPDTSGKYGRILFLHYSNYWFGDDTLEGFSHLHLHGTGATDYGVLSVARVRRDPSHGSATRRSSTRRLNTPRPVAEVTPRTHPREPPRRPGRRAPPRSRRRCARIAADFQTPEAGSSMTLRSSSTRTGSTRGRPTRSARCSTGRDVVHFDAALPPARRGSADGTPAEGRAIPGDEDRRTAVFPASDEPIELVVGIPLVDAAGAAANLPQSCPKAGSTRRRRCARARAERAASRSRACSRSAASSRPRCTTRS